MFISFQDALWDKHCVLPNTMENSDIPCPFPLITVVQIPSLHMLTPSAILVHSCPLSSDATPGGKKHSPPSLTWMRFTIPEVNPSQAEPPAVLEKSMQERF